MKKNIRIIDYFEGNLNESEQKFLLEEIESDAELKKVFKEYEKLYSFLNLSKNVKPNEDYLETIIPKFRTKGNKTKLSLRPVFVSVALLLFITLSILIYNNLRNKTQLEFVDLIEYDEISFIENNIGEYSEILDENHIEDLLFTELLEENFHPSLIKNYIEIDNNYNFISETMAEEIYQELLNKKIL